MTHKEVYELEILTDLTTVAGNISDAQQCYKIGYYPKSIDLPSKIALFTYLVPPELKKQGIMPKPRSLYFSSHEQLKDLIFNLTKAYFFFRDKRIKPDSPVHIFRIMSLTKFLVELRIKQLNNWRK